MNEKHLQALELITQILLQANIGLPIVFSLVSGISLIIKGVVGSGPTLSALADMMEAQLDTNDQFGHTEVARLRELLGIL